MKRIGKLQKHGKILGWKVGKLEEWVRHPSLLPSFHLLLPLFCVSVVFIFIPTTAQSQGINVAAVVSPRHIQFGEKARLDLTISGETFIKHIEAPQFNFLPAFLAVPLHSETTPRLEADKIAVSMAWAYELIPQAIGDFTLSDIRFAYQGTPYFANPGSIRVSGTDTYVDVSTNAIHQVEAEVDTHEPYLNAPLTYTFRYLYTTVLPTRESPTPQFPTFRGFFVENPQKRPLYTQEIRGKTFWVEEHTRTLYPHQKTGQTVLAPAELLLPFPRGHRTLKTKPLTLTVQPIPETGRPAHFNGAIGEYQISAEIDRGWIEAGRELTLTVRISGHGNIQTVTPPKLPSITGVMVSGPNPSEITPASRAYIYALTPVRMGIFRIPAIEYAYFDPNRAVYATIQTTPIPVSVRPHPNDPVGIETDSSPGLRWLILLVILVVLGIGGYLWYRAGFVIPTRRVPKTETRADTLEDGGSRRRKTQDTDTESITPVSQAREALTALTNNDTTDTATPFANAFAQVLYQYLEDTFDLSQRSIDTAREVGTHAGIPEPILDELIDLLTKCDYHRFAPVALSTGERNTLITRAETVINNIETLQNTHDA